MSAMRHSSVLFNDTATTEIYTLSLHDALPISRNGDLPRVARGSRAATFLALHREDPRRRALADRRNRAVGRGRALAREDRKSTRLNSSHANISYAVFCLKKKKSVLSTATAFST